MLITELKPVHSSNKSYYGKATVVTLDNGVKILKSYDTVVCVIVPNVEGTSFAAVAMPWMNWSATTGKHTWDFLLQNNIHINLERSGFKSFASFMRDVSSFLYKDGVASCLDDGCWACKYKSLDSAIRNWKNL